MDLRNSVRAEMPARQTTSSTAQCLILSLLALVLGFASSASAQITVGAIRWDGFMGPSNYVGIQGEADMGPLIYHDRIPFYGVEVSSTAAQAREITQTAMDKDCGYAQQSGITYWAFDFYPRYYLNLPNNTGPDLATGLDLFQSSNDSRCKQLKFALVLATNYVNFRSFVPAIIQYSKSANYQTVLGGRPLIYLFYSNLTRADVSYLRSQSNVNPYIVDMTSASEAANLGADAVSAYNSNAGDNGQGEPYASLASSEQSAWRSLASSSSGLKIVPWATLGWDPRPRVYATQINPSNYNDSIYPGPGDWVQRGEPAQSADEVQQAINWANNSQTTDPSQTVIIYAWNELVEGSNQLQPTLHNGTQMVQALADVLVNTMTPNQALNQTCSASSAWPNYPAANASDGIQLTAWQAASGANYAQQWLECDFPALSTFNQVIVSEYQAGEAGRTAGFRIQDWDGFNWQTIYTGTRIGGPNAPSAFLFPTVTSSKVRLAFTSGTDTPIIYEMEVHNTKGTTNLGVGKSYSSSSNWDSSQAPYWAFNNPGAANWQPAQGSDFSSDWLECDFGVPTTFDRIQINEGYDRTTSYQIDYTSNGVSWSTAYQGGRLGSNATITFPPVTALSVRLKFNSGQYTPIIYSFQIYNQ